MMALTVMRWPVRARVHLVWWGRVALVLGHLVSLRLVRGVGRRVGRAIGRERGICCLSHTGRTTRLRVRSVRLRAGKIILISGRAGWGGIEAVIRLWCIGGRNIGGSNLGLRRVLGSGAHFRLWSVSVMSTSSSRSLVCGMLFRRCFDRRCCWVVRT